MHWFIIGHYGGHNTGDEAMLLGLVRSLRAARPDASLSVITKDGVLPPAVQPYGVRAVPSTLTPVVQEIIRADGVILGGGTHFHDDYSESRYRRHLRYMARITGVSVLARLLGKHVAWLGMGFGPFNRPATRWLTRLGLSVCDVVTVRDRPSLAAIEGWRPSRPSRHMFDLAALAEPDGVQAEGGKHEPGTPIIGVSATSIASTIRGNAEVDEIFWGRFGDALAHVCVQRPDIRVKVFVIRGGDREDDQGLSQNLVNRLHQVAPEHAEFVSYQDNPETMLREIKQCSHFIATRYHAGVLSYLAGCRLLLLAYHRKVSDLADEIGLGRQACIPIERSVRADEMRERIENLIDDAPEFAPTLPVPVAQERAWGSIRCLLDSMQHAC